MDLQTALLPLSQAITLLEELNEGGCRNNCVTAKQQWTEGYQRAMMDYGASPIIRACAEEAALRAWKENKT